MGWLAICMRHLPLFWTVLSHLLAMQKNFNSQPLDSRCMSTMQLLSEIEMLAHADYMTGTLNSGIPYLVEVHCPVGPNLFLNVLSYWHPYCRYYLSDGAINDVQHCKYSTSVLQLLSMNTSSTGAMHSALLYKFHEHCVGPEVHAV